jgi:hypothetical protein
VAELEGKVNELTGEAWEAWVDLNYELGQDRTLHGAADHLLYVVVVAAILMLGMLTQCTRSRGCSLDSLGIIPRAEWGALGPNFDATDENGLFDPVSNPEGWMIYTKPLTEVLTTIVVHHSALPLSDGPLEIQYKHMHQKGFADIGYHYVIDEQGRIYAGRELTVRGAHTGGHNTGTVGVVLLGNFEEAEPTTVQMASLRSLVQCLTTEYAITHLAGHRDFQPEETVCPGENLERALPDLASELGLEFGTGGYVRP